MNFLETLLISRKMKFEDGNIKLYGQGVLILPTQSILEYMKEVSGDIELTKILYSTMKEAVLEYRQNLIGETENSEKANWIRDTINLYGQGRVVYENAETAPIGTLILHDSPLAKNLKGEVKLPVDHILRGIIAGTASAVLETDLDVIETECYVSGHETCKLVLDTKNNLKDNFFSTYKQQI